MICNIQVIALRDCSQTGIFTQDSKGRLSSLLTGEFHMKYKYCSN